MAPKKNNRSNVTSLEVTSKAQYNAAINFYKQREETVIRHQITEAEADGQVDVEKVKERFVEAIFNKGIQPSWQEAMKRIQDNLVKGNGRGAFFKDEKGNKIAGLDIKSDVSQDFLERFAKLLDPSGELKVTADNLKSLFVTKKGKMSGQDFYSKMGQIYEFYWEKMTPIITEGGINVANQATDGVINNMLFGLAQYGSIKFDVKENGSSRSKGASSYIDIGKGLVNDEGKFYGDIELGIDVVPFALDEKGNFTSNEIVRYLTERQGAYGLQLKNFSSKVKEFEQRTAAKMKGIINKEFEEKQPGQKDDRHSWNATYALYYSKMRVSNYLIQLVGPYNLGIGFSDDFMFTSDFLRNFYLNFHVQALRKQGGGKSMEIQPEIHSNNLYAIKSTQGVTPQVTGFKKEINKKREKYYRLKVSNKIKVNS